ncbi:hypothetical protein [Chitinimonas naiadis]
MNMRLIPGNDALPGPAGGITPAPLPAAPVIPRIEEVSPFGYTALRERGIAQTQGLSGDTWTDYNHHDPGVTLLEALCYAMTEGVFGAEMPVADLLSNEDGEIHYRRHGLHAAEEILPCRATTELDYLRWVLDRVPQIRHLRMEMQAASDGLPNGLWQMAVRAPAAVSETVAASAARAYWSQRNLGEDIAEPPLVLAPRWCSLRITLAIEGGRDLTDILAELVQRCSDLISAAPPREPRQVRLAQTDVFGVPLAPSELFDGPPLKYGWIASRDLERDPANRLFFSDLILALQGVEGIAEIRHLSLSAEGLTASDGALPWHGPDWALQLRWPDSPLSLADWTVTRRGSTLAIDAAALLQRLHDDLQANRIVPQDITRVGRAAAEMLARPAGHPSLQQPYYAAFNHLPPLYRGAEVNERIGARQRFDSTAKAQFIAYQALLEQWLAHGDAQLQHLRKLYTIEAAPRQSYWWQPLGDQHVAGLDDLHREGRAGVARSLSVFASADDVLARRGRVLDHLLALHGESCGQRSIQAFGWYYHPRDWQRHLFECKRQLLLRIVRHTRDRAAGFDYSRNSLGRKGNTAPLQQRVSLLLGFTQAHSRALLSTLADLGIGLAREPHPVTDIDSPAASSPLAMWTPLRQRISDQYREDVANRQVTRRLAHYFPGLDLQALPPALLRSAVHADHYLVELHGDRRSEHTLWLGPDESGRHWPLPVRLASGSAIAPAIYLHEFACQLQRECEGLHLIEHILLRPRLPSLNRDDADKVVLDPYFQHQITVVFPGWTARCADRAFRHLAEETVLLGCPAHIQAHVLWLDADTLAEFEAAQRKWLRALQAYSAAPGRPEVEARTLAQRLDQCAEAMRQLLVSAAADAEQKT